MPAWLETENWIKRFFSAALALMFVSGVIIIAIRITEFYSAGGAGYIAADSLFELRDWVNGAPFAERLRHNLSPSHIQSLLLGLDVYAGPYPAWTVMFSYLSVCFAAAIFWRFIGRFSSALRASAIVIVFVGFWFSDPNAAQHLSYSWRLAEVASHLLAIALGALVIMRWNRGTWLDPATLGLLVLVFAFTHVHKGFGFFLVLPVIAALIAPDRRVMAAYAAIAAGYVVYGFAIEGVFWRMAAAAGGGGASGLSQLHEIIAATALLVTAPVRDAMPGFAGEAGSAAARALALAAIVLAGFGAAQALLVGRRDPGSAFTVYLMAATGGVAFLSILGRFEAYGYDVASIPRFWSDGLLIGFAALVYGAFRLSDRIFWPVCGVLFLLAVKLQITSLDPTFHRALYGHNAQAAQWAIAFSGRGEAVGAFNVRAVRAIETTAPVLAEQGVLGFGGLEAVSQQAPWSYEGLPECAGALSVQPDRGGVYSVIRLNLETLDDGRANRMALVKDGAVAAIGPVFDYFSTRRASAFTSVDPAGGVLVVFDHGDGRTRRALCARRIDG